MILDDKRIEHDLPETAIKALNKVLINFDKVFKTFKIKTMLFLILLNFCSIIIKPLKVKQLEVFKFSKFELKFILII